MDDRTDELLWRFPRQRAAITKGSRATRYIVDAFYYGDEARIILGSTVNERTTAVKPESVKLLNGWVGDDHGTIQWMNANEQHDDYRTAQELQDLAPARAARAELAAAATAAIVAFVSADPAGVAQDEIREHVTRELGLDPKDEDLFGTALYAARDSIERGRHFGNYTVRKTADGR